MNPDLIKLYTLMLKKEAVIKSVDTRDGCVHIFLTAPAYDLRELGYYQASSGWDVILRPKE